MCLFKFHSCLYCLNCWNSSIVCSIFNFSKWILLLRLPSNTHFPQKFHYSSNPLEELRTFHIYILIARWMSVSKWAGNNSWVCEVCFLSLQSVRLLLNSGRKPKNLHFPSTQQNATACYISLSLDNTPCLLTQGNIYNIYRPTLIMTPGLELEVPLCHQQLLNEEYVRQICRLWLQLLNSSISSLLNRCVESL